MAEQWTWETISLVKEINRNIQDILDKKPAHLFKGRNMPKSTTKLLVVLAKEKGYGPLDLEVIEEMGKGNKI